MWCRQGERCKAIFIAGKNLVEHQEQLQDWAGKWLPVKTERPAGSMRHFRTGSSNSGFQPRGSGSKEQRGSELQEMVEVIKRWCHNDWIALDNKLRNQ